MRLKKFSGHALRILMDCAQAEGEVVSAAELSRRLDITLQNTFKITHMLSREGYLETLRGSKGGVRLAMPPEKIRIGDVVRRVEVLAVQVEDGDLPAKGGKAGQSRINKLLDQALEAFIATLDLHTIKEMADNEAPNKRSSPAAAKAKRDRG